MATQETQLLDEEIVKTRRKMIALGGVTLAGLLLHSSKVSAQSASYTDADILNFALNLEYLEANFYYICAFGCTIDAPSAAAVTAGAPAAGISISGGGVGAQGSVTASGAPLNGVGVPFTSIAVGSYATETAIEEGKHVLFLQSALGSAAVAQPQISLDVSTWSALANAAGLGTTFTPYDTDADFLLGAYVFEDVGVTAYHGAASLLTVSGNLSAAAGILSVEAYHAGLIRTTISAAYPADIPATTAISNLRATLSAAALLGVAPGPYDGGSTTPAGPDDYGVATFTAQLTAGTNVTATRIVDADPVNAIAFARNTTQVLNIVTGGGAVNGTTVISPAKGIFFPNGLNAGPNGFK